jgi:glycogen operon protein
MTEEDWRFPNGRFLSYVLAPIERGQPPVFIVINAAPEAIAFTLPKVPECDAWRKVHDTSCATSAGDAIAASTRLSAPERSVLLFSGEARQAA